MRNRDRVMVYNITNEGREVLSEVYLLNDFSLEDIINEYDTIEMEYSKEGFLTGKINQAVFREGERAYRLYVVDLEQATEIIDSNRQRELDIVLAGGLKREVYFGI